MMTRLLTGLGSLWGNDTETGKNLPISNEEAPK
jgi:hypothetical protein